jgi:hypothetical protein
MALSLLLIGATTASAAVTDRDRTFNFTGQVLTNAGGLEIARGVALQPDGKLVTIADSSTGISYVRRLLPDGSPDDRFGLNGVIRIGTGNTAEPLRAVLVQPDGKILVGGSSSFKPVIYRLRRAGQARPRLGRRGQVPALVAHRGRQGARVAARRAGHRRRQR